MNKVAVVILNLNGLQFLQSFLAKVVAYSQPHKVIVADNGSSDGSASWIRQHFPEMQIIEFPVNYGFCTGYNRALKECQADNYILLNSDVEVTPGWIEPMLSILEREPEVAAIQPKMLSHDQRDRFEYAGAAGGFIDAWGYPFCRGRIFQHMEIDSGQYNTESEIFWASGACMLIRASLFHEFNGLDDDLFAHMEEIDLCWRMQNAGYKIKYTPESTIYHIGGGTLPKLNPKKTYLNFRNALIVLIKNLPGAQLWWKFPLRLGLDFIAATKFLFTGEVENAFAVLKAHLGMWRHFRKHLHKRGGYKNPENHFAGMYSGSLLYSYHVKKVRKFSELMSG